MFHVFTAPSSTSPPGAGADHQTREPTTRKHAAGSGPASLTRSCAECRRRRIKCDSAGPPCGQCTWYKVESKCYFPARRQRHVPSLKSHQEIKTIADKSSKVLKTLFPNKPLDKLASMSRAEMLQLLQTDPGTETEDAGGESSEEDLQCIELSPQQEFEYDESEETRVPGSYISDDVNGLSLALDSKSSYLGISSISAVLRVIIHIAPGAKTLISQHAVKAADMYQEGPRALKDALVTDEMLCIDAYFTHVHNSNPMLDEAQFRAKYMNGPHSDPPWIALLNMVLTMGSVAASEANNHAHFIFYQRAYPHLALENLGAGHLETVQALAILGGSYLHYLNKPNLATVVTGAALRMGLGLGLHREPIQSSAAVSKEANVLFETRRRTWWSLFCYDTWGSTTLGRPSLGRWDPRCITVQPPKPLGPQDYAALCLRASVEFCKIGTAIQDRFARAPLISSREVLEFDAQLLEWESQIPVELQDLKSTPERASWDLIKGRYLNLRLVLYRPRLLICCLRRKRRLSLLDEEQQVVDTCRKIADSVVKEVSRCWFKNQISAWNGVWMLFQAIMIPLLSLFSEPEHDLVAQWRHNVETAISLFEEMQDFSLTAMRSREVVSKIYEASQSVRFSRSEGMSGEFPELEWPAGQTWPFVDDMDWFNTMPEFSDVTFDLDYLAGPYTQNY